MEAKRCDRCGKFFCPNDHTGESIQCVTAFGPGGEKVPVNWIGRSETRWLDICYDCKDEFVIWWKEAQNDTSN